MKICLVCLGNICRSPMAEVVLRAELAKAGIEADVDSAGINTGHAGQPMHPYASAALAIRGYSGEGHAARQFDRSWERDLFLAMDNANLADLRQMGKNAHLFAETEIPDPYFGGPADFIFALDMIEKAVPAVIGRIAGIIAACP